jgi:hypothetical protein
MIATLNLYTNEIRFNESLIHRWYIIKRSDSELDSDICTQILQAQEEIQEAQSEGDQGRQVLLNLVFILAKGNTTKIIRDFIYNVAPTTYYDHSGVLRIDEYKFVEMKDNKCYYEFVEPKKRLDKGV